MATGIPSRSDAARRVGTAAFTPAAMLRAGARGTVLCHALVVRRALPTTTPWIADPRTARGEFVAAHALLRDTTERFDAISKLAYRVAWIGPAIVGATDCYGFWSSVAEPRLTFEVSRLPGSTRAGVPRACHQEARDDEHEGTPIAHGCLPVKTKRRCAASGRSTRSPAARPRGRRLRRRPCRRARRRRPRRPRWRG